MIVFAGTLQGASVPPATHNLWTASKQKILPKDDKHRLWSFLSWLLQEIHEIPGFNRLIQSFLGVGESIISSGYLIEAQRQKICTSLGVLYLHFYIYTAFGVLYFLHVYTFTLIHPVGI